MANYAGRLVNVAVNAEYIAELSVADAAGRDAAVAAGSAPIGVVISQRDSGNRDLVLSLAPTYQALGPVGTGGATIVADVVARDALGGLFEGLTVLSQASGIVWRLRADLVTWDVVANYAPSLYDFDAELAAFSLFERVHKVYVETTGSDAAGEGTVANPFATPQAALDSVPDANGSSVLLQLGLGSFDITTRLIFRSTSGKFYLIGTPVVVESLPIPDSFADITDKAAQSRNTYLVAPTTTIVDGTHWLLGVFAFPDHYRFSRALLATSAGFDLDILGDNAFGPSDVVTWGTTLTSTGEMYIQMADQATLNGSSAFGGVNGCQLSAGGNIRVEGVQLTSCPLVLGFSLFIGGPNARGGASLSGCWTGGLTGQLFTTGEFNLQLCLLDLVFPILVTSPGAYSNNLSRYAGTHITMGDAQNFGRLAPWQVYGSDNDFEGAAICIDLRAGRWFQDQRFNSITNCAKWMRVKGPGVYEIEASNVRGNASGDAIEVLAGGMVNGVLDLTTLTATGSELVIGGVGRTFVTAPHTDIADLSQVTP